jgi:hypothetical protein
MRVLVGSNLVRRILFSFPESAVAIDRPTNVSPQMLVGRVDVLADNQLPELCDRSIAGCEAISSITKCTNARRALTKRCHDQIRSK